MQTIRSLCGSVRISFSDNLWGKPFKFDKPRLSFVDGSAILSFYSLEEAVQYYRKRGYKFKEM